MARLNGLESRISLRVVAGVMSAILHVGLFLLLAFPGGRQLGLDARDETPSAQLVMLENLAVDRRTARASTQWMPAALAANPHERPRLLAIQPPSEWLPVPPDEPEQAEDSSNAIEPAVVDEDPKPDIAEDPVPATVIPKAEATALLRRIERLARKKLPTQPRASTSWTQDGKQYEATLVFERDRDGVEADRVIAEVTAQSEGKRRLTRLMLRRLNYSQFAQIIDHWDTRVQLHDDEVVGPTHINTRFNVLSDAEARPALLGKVSTAAYGFTLRSTGGTRESDVFLGGIRTGVGRITLSGRIDPLAWGPDRIGARVHEFATDTHVQFLGDGSYAWRGDEPGAEQHRREPSSGSVYFVAAPGVRLAVQGTVSGKVLVYSPQGIVVEGSLTYAHDPRATPDADDYLGLVSDRDIEVAPPAVIGPGDVDIHAAMFARRRFVVAEFEHRPPARLRIYGSLAAGTVTASEPRYAMKIEFDRRFETRRPPGFPNMNRYVADGWDRRWVEAPEDTASGAP